MKFSAKINNSARRHRVEVSTDDLLTTFEINPKAVGRGSSINGGELLFLSLATCYCNDIFREAAERKIEVDSLEVQVEGEFGGRGEPALNIYFVVKISAGADEERIRDLIHRTDGVAEIHNTLRMAVPVQLRHTKIF